MRQTDKEIYIYEYSWKDVLGGYLKRFPTNPKLPILIDSRVELDQRSSDGATRTIHRRCWVAVEAPEWLKKAFNAHSLEFMQISVIDYDKESMKIEIQNESFKDKLYMRDYSEYRRDDANPQRTIFEQWAVFKLPNFPLSGFCEQYAVKSFNKNKSQGRLVDLELIVEYLAEKKSRPMMIAKKSNDNSSRHDVDGGEGTKIVTNGSIEKMDTSILQKNESFSSLVNGTIGSSQTPSLTAAVVSKNCTSGVVVAATVQDTSPSSPFLLSSQSKKQETTPPTSASPIAKTLAVTDHHLSESPRDNNVFVLDGTLNSARNNISFRIFGEAAPMLYILGGLLVVIFPISLTILELYFPSGFGAAFIWGAFVCLGWTVLSLSVMHPDIFRTLIVVPAPNSSSMNSSLQQQQQIVTNQQQIAMLSPTLVDEPQSSIDHNPKMDESVVQLESLKPLPLIANDDDFSGSEVEEMPVESDTEEDVEIEVVDDDDSLESSEEDAAEEELAFLDGKAPKSANVVATKKKRYGGVLRMIGAAAAAATRKSPHKSNLKSKVLARFKRSGKRDSDAKRTKDNYHKSVMTFKSYLPAQGVLRREQVLKSISQRSLKIHIPAWVVKIVNGKRIVFYMLSIQSESLQAPVHLFKTFPEFLQLSKNLVFELGKNSPLLLVESKIAMPKILRKLLRMYPSAMQNLSYPTQRQTTIGLGNNGQQQLQPSLSTAEDDDEEDGSDSAMLNNTASMSSSDMEEYDSWSGLFFQYTLFQDFRRTCFEEFLDRIIVRASAAGGDIGNVIAGFLFESPLHGRGSTHFPGNNNNNNNNVNNNVTIPIDMSKTVSPKFRLMPPAPTKIIMSGLFLKAKDIKHWSETFVVLDNDKVSLYNYSRDFIEGLVGKGEKGDKGDVLLFRQNGGGDFSETEIVISRPADYAFRISNVRAVFKIEQVIPGHECLQIELKDYSALYLCCPGESVLSAWMDQITSLMDICTHVKKSSMEAKGDIAVASHSRSSSINHQVDPVVTGALEGYPCKTLSNGMYPITSQTKSYYKAPMFLDSAETGKSFGGSGNGDGRMILNQRFICFHKHNGGVMDSAACLISDVCGQRVTIKGLSENAAEAVSYSQKLLDFALNIFQDFTVHKCIINGGFVLSLQRLGTFAAALQVVNIDMLTHPHRTAFFTNVYHTLLLHAYLDIGRPGSRALSELFCAKSCYIVGGMCFSLRELDQWFVRYGLSKQPSFSVGGALRATLPYGGRSSQTMGLKVSDWDPRKSHILNQTLVTDPRMHMILNNGTQSCLYHVYVLDSERLDEQLEHIAFHFMDEQVRIDFDNRIIYLPRLFQWYAKDFIANPGSTVSVNSTSRSYLIDYLVPMFAPHTRTKLSNFLHACNNQIKSLAAIDNDSTNNNNNNNTNNLGNGNNPNVSNSGKKRSSIHADPANVVVAAAAGDEDSCTTLSLRHMFKVKFVEMQTQMRGVFFKGHEIDEPGCSLADHHHAHHYNHHNHHHHK